MPEQTQAAVNWALQQQYEIELGVVVDVSTDYPFAVVDKVREYFNAHSIPYNTFSYDDLIPYLPE